MTASVIELKKLALEIDPADQKEFFIIYQNTTMASTEARNKNRTRPTKSNGARTKRQNDHRKRLIALGMDEATVAAMDPKQVRTKLKHPAKVAKECAAQES